MSHVLSLDIEARPAARRRHRGPGASKGLAALDALARSYSFRSITRAAEAGQSVIWGGWSWESPLVYASDTIPVSYDQLWAEESRASEAIAEDHFQVPPEFCSMIKAMLGRLHIDRDTPIKRILHFGSGCEPIHSVLELAKQDGYDIFTLDTVTAFRSKDKNAASIAFLVEELRRLSHWLTGKPVDEERLAVEIRRKNRVLRKVARLLELRARHPLDVPGIQTRQIFMGAMHGFGDLEAFGAVLDTLIAELEDLDDEPEAPTYIPVVLAGSVGNVQIFQAIEESNGAIVGWVYHGADTYREDLPPLESLAHYVLDAQSRGDLGEAVGASVAYRRILVEEEVRKTGARGIISSSITGCPYASLMQQLERDHFKHAGIPLITLETDVHKEPPTEEQIMRVKAFIEMLA
ncbi:2-hydroxyacyl-CoA dehydratase family protein [Blastochloris viridis]|uniref:2-hydroxyglutaryl-CoA dehydratase (Component D) related protein n=1 Tax=Blastochloris viridis TaxID=1079 RepID=A0A0H5BQ28_BLAVI|nr:2-hydroxyacyl-CoA dehydratase family protein [Blastochloris viridis]ALK09851.1 2-hydroxyglutaryl-CoA dehydratase, D-component [Blastochloris viridis]BAS00244.1 2-hydroxyglutaryl-CoA dehydratase (Component D) related protein [Blastochloris viridis]CUU42514.1 2-hydroxyglutaryl-CoA dehydratase, D-component [Blastochloris viridis]